MNIAVILAGGVGSRLRDDGFPKQYIEVNGKPVLVYSLEKFQACDAVDRIVVVAREQWKESILSWCAQYGISKLSAIADPGETRQESILSGLLACEQYSVGADDIVAIHDGARPLVSCQLIENSIDATKSYDGCLPVVSPKDSMYYSPDGQTIAGLVDRSTSFCGQTPECFKLHAYLELNRNTTGEQLKLSRGSSELAFRNGFTICMIPGEETNFKLTTKEDLDRFCIICSNSESS